MPKAFSTARMLARVWPMEQMPQILPLIQGAFSHFLPTSIASKNRGVSTTSHRASSSLPVLDPDLDVAVAFDPGEVMDVDGAGDFMVILHFRKR